MSTPQDELTSQMQGGAQSDLERDTKEYANLPKEFPVESFNPNDDASKQEPQRNMGIMATMPYIVGLAALGGKAAGLHAKTMLGGVNGMVQGTIQGNEKAYADSKKKYDDAYQRWLDKFTQQQKLYNEMRQVYKGRIDADQKALEFARRATNDESRDKHNDFRNWMAEQEYARKLTETNSQVDHRKAEEAIAKERVERAKAAATKKQTDHAQAIDGTIGEIDDLIAQLQKNPDVAGLRGYFTRGVETLKTATGIGEKTDPKTGEITSDVHAHQFQTAMEALMLKVPKLLTGSSKSAKDERQRVDSIANALKVGSTGPIAIGKLNELKSILQGQKTIVGDQPDEHGFVVGTDYTNPKGQRATYLGDGQWQTIPSTP